MNPLVLKDAIEIALHNDLKEKLPIYKKNESIGSALENAAKNYHFVQEPYIEPQPLYQHGRSLKDLIDAKLIHKVTAKLFALSNGCKDDNNSLDCFFNNFKLYKHQERALENVRNGNNLIVCSGTGSGKTECFLLPLLDYLVKEKVEHNQVEKGVRALILYPMNALVNDQLRRLRNILRHCKKIDELKNCPITFGKFTGETPAIDKEISFSLSEDQKRKADDLLNVDVQVYSSLADDIAVDNEIVKRSDWCGSNVGDILVTNYSMLERLMLRPDTTSIFKTGKFWRFIILDEAHSYDGSQGTEIAWLVRRLSQRIKYNINEKLQFIATSATLIDGNKNEIKEALSRTGIQDLKFEIESDVNELKSIYIRNEFASKIFPAPPDSFHIEFGSQILNFDKIKDYKGESIVYILEKEIPSEEIIKIIEDNKFLLYSYEKEGDLKNYCDFLLWFNAVKSFWDKCIKLIEFYRDDIELISAGDLLELLKFLVYISPVFNQVKRDDFPRLDKDKAIGGQIIGVDKFAVVKDTDCFSWCYDIVEKYLDFDNEKNERLLDALHDDLDIRNNYQRTTEKGNKKDFLIKEWKEITNVDSELSLSQLSVTGLDYLLRITHEAVMDIDEGKYSPYKIPLLLEHDFINKVKEWKKCVSDICKALTKLENCIKKQIGELTKDDEYTSNSIEKLLGRSILSNDIFHCLRDYTTKCHQRIDGKTPKDSTFSKTAEVLFPKEPTEDKTKLLDKWNTYASLGQSEDGRPLWDIRYHQMVRGIPGAIIRFSIEEVADPEDEKFYNLVLVKPEVDFNLYASLNDENLKAEDGKSRWFIFGVCYRCYHPYLIGYSDQEFVNEEGVFLHTIESDTYRYKHVFIPCNMFEGDVDGDNNQIKYVYLDPEEGKLYSSNPNPDDNRIECRYYYNSDYEVTPCCGIKPKRDTIVSVYRYMGDLSKATVMATILNQTPPSSNPVSRSYFGEGRKLIAFSDTRHQAARLAVEFDKSIRDKNMAYLLYHAIRAKQNVLMEEDYENNISLQKSAAELFVKTLIQNSNLCSIGVSLRNKIKDKNLEEQFLWLDYEDGSKMLSWDASILQLVRSLRNDKVLLERIGARLDCPNSNLIINELVKRANKSGLNLNNDKAKIAFGELLLYLISTAALSRGSNYQNEGKELRVYEPPSSYCFLWGSKQYSHDFLYGIHPNWYHLIDNKKNDRGDIVLGDQDKTRKVNKIIFKAFEGDNDINKCYKVIGGWFHDEVWPRFTQRDGNVTLIDDHNRYFQPQNLNIIPLDNVDEPDDPFAARIEEHTAQINSSLGRSYQNAFAEGKINVLSCSTTFEMGVDLGDLSSVFLSNQPPSVANYKQRAGRAGRRAGMAANVITYIGDDSHDRYYFQHPDEMFFGKVTPPVIYLDNPVFRARHLRAEAMHDFLVWATGKHELRGWDKVGHFFFGKNSVLKGERDNCWLNSLVDWANCKDVQQKLNERIIDIMGGELDYQVKDDLLWQLIGVNNFGGNNNLSLYHRLAGPNMGNNMDHALFMRMVEKLANVWPCDDNKEVLQYRSIDNLDNLHNLFDNVQNCSSYRALKRFLLENTIDYLTRSRVLPLYGFPSDVVELVKDKSDSSKVELTRDMKQGLYEYAPGKEVLANKRVFVSSKPIFYALPRSRNEQHGVLNVPELPHDYKWCRNCVKIIGRENNLCPYCNKPLFNAYRPDAFQAEKSKSAQSFSFNKPDKRIFDVPGPAAEYFHTKYNFSVSENEKKEVIYLNTNNNNGFSLKYGKHDINYCLIHIVHTDVLHIKLNADFLPQEFKEERKENAWKSVASSLKIAIQDLLNVSKRDVSVKPEPDDLSWAIFDISSGGAGFMYELLLSKNSVEELGQQEVKRRVSLIRTIIHKAKDIVEGERGCACYKMAEEEREKIPSNYGNVITAPDTYRSHRSCYHCLRSYENKNEHDILDVHDAAVILKAMLGENAD